MKKVLIIIIVFISVTFMGGSKTQETIDTFKLNHDKAVYTVNVEDTVVSSKEYKRNFYINLYHSNDLVLKEEIVEEYFFDQDAEYELISTKENFKFLEQSEAFNHDGVGFEYVVDDTYLKVIITIDFEKIEFNNIDDFLFDFIGGEQALNSEQKVSYQKLSGFLLESGLNHVE